MIKSPYKMICALALVGSAVFAVSLVASDLKTKTTTLKKSAKDKYDYIAKFPTFLGSGPVVKLANEHFSHTARGVMKNAMDNYNDVDGRGTLPYSLDHSVTIGVAHTDLISAYAEESVFFGGAHGMLYYRPATFGKVNGVARKLKLVDLLKSKAARQDVKDKLVLAKLMAAKKKNDGSMDWEIEDWTIESFVVTKTGIVWLFQPYSAGSYAEGTFEIKASFKELDPYINKNGPLKPILK